MLFTFNFDFANEKHVMAFTELAKMGIVPISDVATPVVTSVATPVVTPKTYAPATDVICKWVLDGTHVTYTLANGKYVGQTGARKTLNARLRENGAKYDTEKKVWVFSTKDKAQKFVVNDYMNYCEREDITALEEVANYTVVTAQEIEDVRVKAQARAEKKANK